MKDSLPRTIYLLFSGDSPDGMGSPKYKGRTLDKEKARKHFLKCEKDPYSTGNVEKLTSKKLQRVMKEEDL